MKYLYIIFILLSMGLAASGGETYLVNGDFELGEKGWGPLPANIRIDSFVGHEGTAAMVFEQSRPNSQDAVVSQALLVHAQGFYTLRALVKSEQFTGTPLRVGVEFLQRKERLYAFERHLLGPLGTTSWHEVMLDFTVPAEATDAKLVITFPANAAGRVWLDRITLQKGDYPYQLALVYPLQGEIDAENPSVRIAIQRPGERSLAGNLMQYTLKVQVNGRQLLRPAAPIVEIPLGMHFDAGSSIQMTAELLERDNQRVAARIFENLRVRPASSQPQKPQLVQLDAHKRATFAGKPFFPIGLLAYMERGGQANLPMLIPAEHGNVISPANDLLAILETATPSCPQIAPPLALLRDTTSARLGSSTTYLINEELLMKFSRQSALLAWLSSDDSVEQPIAASRKALHEFDSHPLARLVPTGVEPARLLGNADILLAAFDAPGEAAPQAALQRARSYARELLATGLPIWALLKPSSQGKASLESMRGLTILLAMEGIRGFFFAPQLEGFIGEVSNLLQMLEPYILSNIPPRDVMLTVAKGDAIAKEFTDHQGRKVILLVGGFQGKKTIASFTLPATTKITSRFGNTRQSRDGSCRFQGKGVLYDLLELSNR